MNNKLRQWHKCQGNAQGKDIMMIDNQVQAAKQVELIVKNWVDELILEQDSLPCKINILLDIKFNVDKNIGLWHD